MEPTDVAPTDVAPTDVAPTDVAPTDVAPTHVVGRAALDRAALARLADAGVLTALVDACDAPGVPERVLARVPDGGACLYQGAEALAFRDRAPYLVRVDGEVLAWLLAPGADGGLGDTPWGMFAVSDAPFAALVRHWRGWLTVTPPGAPSGEPWAFRFYDPRLLDVFLSACTPEEIAAFFGPVRSLGVPSGKAARAGGSTAAGALLTPGVAVRRTTAARRGVGERFQLRDAHLAAFRRRSFGDALVASVEQESAATGHHAWRDPADDAAGDILIRHPDGEAPLRIGFDAQGFIGRVTSPIGRTWQIMSDADGRVRRTVTPAGTALSFERTAHAALHDPDGTAGARAPGERTAIRRGPLNAEQLLFVTDCDQWGRLSAAHYPDTTTVRVVYQHEGDAGVVDRGGTQPIAITDRLGRTIRFKYDDAGRLTRHTDALGRDTRFVYSQTGRADAAFYPGGRLERYSYDAAGQLSGIAYSDRTTLGVVCDSAGQLAHLAHPGSVSVAPVNVAFARDEDGHVTRAATGSAAHAGSLQAASRPGAPTAAGFDSSVRVSYADGRVVAEHATIGVPSPGDNAGDAGASESAVSYTYDARGALVGLTYPTGEQVRYTWDADGRLTGVTDWDGRAYTVRHADADRGWVLHTPAGVAFTSMRDGAGRLTERAVSAPRAADEDARTLSRTTWAYDAEDQVVLAEDARLGAWRYVYDVEGQLVGCQGPTATETAAYAYDPAGNRQVVTEGEACVPDAVVIGAGHELLQQGQLRLAYDPNGRAIALHAAAAGTRGAWRFVYDGRGQLVHAIGPAPRGDDTQIVSCGYDAFGRRVEKLCIVYTPRSRAATGAPPTERAVRATRTRFVWAGEHLIREVEERATWDPDRAGAPRDEQTGTPLAVPADVAWTLVEAREYAYWPGTATPLFLRSTTGAPPMPGAPPGTDDGARARTFVYECDYLATPVRLFDERGDVVWEAAYAPFGHARPVVDEVRQPWRRPGQYEDGETGLFYNRFRYYDPRIGRYLTPDPVGLAGGAHPYRYAANAPTTNADPLGLWPTWGQIGRFVAVAAVGLAVGALVLATGPVSIPLLLAAGVVGGAAAGVANEMFDTGLTCPRCLAMAALKGGAVGFAATLPIVALPLLGLAEAGAAVYAGAGAISGAINYTGGWLAAGAHADQWSWWGFTASTGVGAATMGYVRQQGFKVPTRTVAPSEAPALVPDAPAATSSVPAGPPAPPAEPTAYSVAYETELNPADFGKSRSVHFNRSNAALDNALQSDPEFAASMDQLIPGVESSVSSTGGRTTPSGWTWEHAASSTANGRQGVMRLVPTEQHTPGSAWWRVLHPDPGAAGGYSEWAIPAGAPRN